MRAFSSRSSIGKVTSDTRRRSRVGNSSQAAVHSAKTSAPSGSSLTALTAGPTSARWASTTLPATPPAKPSMTPCMSFNRSHLDTCTTSGADGSIGPPSLTNVAVRVMAARWPVGRFDRGALPASMPALRRMPAISAGDSSVFFSENGSIEGGIALTDSGAIQCGA